MKVRFSPLLATGTRTMVPTLVLFSLYLLVVGHDIPGGGFAGGLIASTALLLIYLAFGHHGLHRALPVDPEVITGIGLAVAIVAGLIGLVADQSFLAYAYAVIELPLLGDIKVSSVLLFDVGVYLLVIGMVGIATTHLGSERT